MTLRRNKNLPFSEVPDLPRLTIHVGEICASRAPAVLQTLLGSCVSVCLMDRMARVGGMNHILLPGRANLDNFDAARYGINAMDLLIGKVQSMGADRKNLVAKVFGGGKVLNGLEKHFNPGLRNGTFALEFLKREGIRVTARDIGGSHARRIYMRTDTGEVLMKRVPEYSAAARAWEEERLRKKVDEEILKGGRVILFDKR